MYLAANGGEDDAADAGRIEEIAIEPGHPRRIIIVLVLAVSAAIMLSIFSRIENWKRDLTTNYAKLDPNSPDPMLRPLTIPSSPDEVADRVEQWVARQPRWSIEAREKTDSAITLHLIHRTTLMRFTDDIHVRLEIDGKQTRVEAESQSRVGKGDLGQNPRNLKELVSGLGAGS